MVKPNTVRRRTTGRGALAVWMNGLRVGTWTTAQNKAPQFQYDLAWIESPEARVLSLSLPFRPGNLPQEGAAVEHYFDNLLPDNREIRQRLQQRFATSSARAFDLLAEVGRDCAGAIQLLPLGEAPDGWNRIDAIPLSDDDIAAHLRAAAGMSIVDHADEDDFRISIAGAQEKSALLQHQGKWSQPRGATPTSHIFKLPLGLVGNIGADFSTPIENEWLCSKLVTAFGLPVASCNIGVFGDTKALIVERFDRRLAASGQFWLRLPQEDMCQATGTPSALKYESDGGPGMRAILKILRGSSRALQDRRTFLKAQILFWMLAAPDGHAKNFSLFHQRGGTYRATPLYDILSAWPIIGNGPNQLSWHRARLAMAVRATNAHYLLRDIKRRDFNATAHREGVGSDAEDIITDLIACTPRAIAEAESLLPAGFPDRVATTIFEGLNKAAAALERMPAWADGHDRR